MFTGLASPTHLLLVLVVILLVFGAKRLPEMGRSLGQGLREFKGGLNTEEELPEKESNSSEAVEEVQEKDISVRAAQKDEPQKKQASA
jgi:sec-independent protein translocase protein TatA